MLPPKLQQRPGGALLGEQPQDTSSGGFRTLQAAVAIRNAKRVGRNRAACQGWEAFKDSGRVGCSLSNLQIHGNRGFSALKS